ncbi:MAG: hypothetical protein ACRD11_02945, partial [Terriglobia bacterium]
EVSSVETASHMVVDARVENEGNGWAGSGANPWHLDKNTESILYLTNESDKAARIGFSITANGVHYYLNDLRLQPYETRAINIRLLRDAQIPDFRGSKIPANATDGSVNWIRIDNVAVMGRLMAITRNGRMNSSYDCCVSCCPASLFNLAVTGPYGFDLLPGQSQQLNDVGYYQDCNGNQTFPTIYAIWSSDDPNAASVSAGDVTAHNAGSPTITATASGYAYDCSDCPTCDASTVEVSGSDPVTVGAYPLNFRQTAGYDAGRGQLHFGYAWESSTGKLSDLSNCQVNEIVTYPGNANPYYWPDPPWDQGTPNPTTGGVNGNLGASVDDHYPEQFASPPYMAAGFTATQSYVYTCYSGALKGTLMGPLNINRVVSGSGSTDTYTGTKSGVSASCTLPNCAEGP